MKIKHFLSTLFFIASCLIVAGTAAQKFPEVENAFPILSFVIITGCAIVSYWHYKKAIHVTTLICGKISAGFGPNCNFKLRPGVNERLLLFNFGEIEVTTENVTTKAIEAFTNGTGFQSYEYFGQLLSNEPKYEAVIKKYDVLYKHTVKFLAFDVSPAAKLQIEKMALGRLGGIIEYNYRGTSGNSAFDLYGRGGGLYVAGIERDPNNVDNSGAIVIILASRDEALEDRLPQSIFITDYATTKAMVDDTLVVGP